MTVELSDPPDGAADALLVAAGTTTPLALAFKARVNAGTARLLVESIEATGEHPFVLVAGRTTQDARRILREAGLGVVDDAGNAHIELPGVVVHVEGPPGRAAKRQTPTRLSGKAGVVAQALLIDRERAWKITELAEHAEVSMGLAHRVVARLEEEGIVRVEGAGPARTRHLANPAALLDLWAEEQRDQPLRTRAFVLAQTARQTIDILGDGLENARLAHAFTGPAGASLVAPFVTTIPVVEVWCAATAVPEGLCEAVGGEPVDDGHNVVFLQAKDDGALVFREQRGGCWVANPFRLYVDLLRSPQRGRDQAEHLRAQEIGF